MTRKEAFEAALQKLCEEYFGYANLETLTVTERLIYFEKAQAVATVLKDGGVVRAIESTLRSMPNSELLVLIK